MILCEFRMEKNRVHFVLELKIKLCGLLEYPTVSDSFCPVGSCAVVREIVMVVPRFCSGFRNKNEASTFKRGTGMV